MYLYQIYDRVDGLELNQGYLQLLGHRISSNIKFGNQILNYDDLRSIRREFARIHR